MCTGAHAGRARRASRRLRAVRCLLPAAPGRQPAPEVPSAAGRGVTRRLPRQQQDVLPGTGTAPHPAAPVPGLPHRENQRIRPADYGPAAAAVSAATPSRSGDRGNPGVVPRPPSHRQPHHLQCPAGAPPALVPRQDPLARRPLVARPADTLGRRRRRPARRDQRHDRPGDRARPSRLRRPQRPARPGRQRLPPLHGGRAHPAACPGAPARTPPDLPPARHLAARTGNPAVQRQRMPGHHGRRAPGTPAPRHCTIEQLIYARTQAAHTPDGQAGTARAWRRRIQALIDADPRTVTESCPQTLFLAAAYPETIATAAAATQAPAPTPQSPAAGGPTTTNRPRRSAVFLPAARSA